MNYNPAASLADPPDQSVLLAAIGWTQGTLLGTVSTVIATISIASIGMAMLGGRIDLRRGVTILVGCFILFGATAIAQGLRDVAGAVGSFPSATPGMATAAPPMLSVPPKSPTPADPYAGAAVPK